MRCFVTGAAGFIGSTLSETLLNDGHEVTGIDCFIDYYPEAIKRRNLEAALAHENYRFVEQNLLDADLPALLDGVDWVFHQAAQAGVRASWGESFRIYTDNNILATQQLLEACRTPGVLGTLKKVVYASSSSVYGNAESLPTLETALPQPVSPYGVSKLAAEHLMNLYTKEFNVPTVSLRYFTVYGPRQRPDMAFNRFITAALTNEAITLYGDGEQSRDFTFIEDIVRANIQAAGAKHQDLVFNLGGGSRVTVNQVIAMLEEIIGTSISIDRHDRQEGDARHTGADTSRAQNQLKFSVTTNLKTGLEKEVRWLESLLAAS